MLAHTEQQRRQAGPGSIRRKMGTAAAVFALAAVAIAPITASTSGMMTAPIQMQARRPLPPHKLRMLFGEDHEGYRRFLEESAPPSRAIAADGSTGSPPEADLPLHAGYGTHYAFVFVGTPAQRVSVILDTGSHWTAFPCTGCQMCGDDHTDPVFDVLKSDTFHALDCSECKFSGHCKDNKCSISLAYAEGSRWDAYEVRDTLFLGGESPQAPVRGGQDLSMPFVFGCQTYETGLFRTQLENGIMGLSFQDLTIVPRLREAGKIDATVFSLCFTEDGGSMRIGGYETEHHTKPLQWVPLTKPTGWYTVTLKDIKIGNTSIGVDPNLFNAGQGTIVDSGTTDTYLPRSVASAFQRVFQDVAGIAYSSRSMRLSPSEMEALPPLVFVLDNGVEVPMPRENYLECLENGASCAGSVFLDNGSGAVLGANFMRGQDVVFNLDDKQIGFAPASCAYVEGESSPAPVVSTAAASAGEGGKEDLDCEMAVGDPVGECSAVCPEDGKEAGVLEGEQKMEMKISRPASGNGKACPPLPLKEKTVPCQVTCNGTVAPAGKGSAAAPVTTCSNAVVWGPCDASCQQTGEAMEKKEEQGVVSCQKTTRTRPCATGLACPAAQEGSVMDVVFVLEGDGLGEEGGLSEEEEAFLLSHLSEILMLSGGNMEVVPSERKAAAGETIVKVRVHLTEEQAELKQNKLTGVEDPLAVQEEEDEGLKAGMSAQAKSLHARVQEPTFAAGLMDGLKASSGALGGLKALRVDNIVVEDVGGGTWKDAAEDGGENAHPMIWKLLGGVGALFVGLMMFVHMRRTGGPGGRAGGMGVSPRVAAAAAMDRVRRGTESMQAGLVGGGGGGGGNGGGGGAGNPTPGRTNS
ncbi:Peptidase aspartic [Nannochloropsis gaditana]|uniref:Peptidase aspartic n=1 Tax=Nannochloropsis gaditana TaxID=72520 RepID=W7TJR4_9STRA|nr:Peptidase aspartic [Nannochloropsis gaditana]